MDLHELIGEWQAFYVASTGASAVLLGLTFLGVSAHLERTGSHARLIPLAVSSTVPLYYSVLVSLVLLFPPAQPLVPTLLLILLGAVGGAATGGPVFNGEIRGPLIANSGRRGLLRFVAPWLTAVTLVAVALLIAVLPGPGLYALALLVLVDIGLGTQNAFDVLLIEIRGKGR